MRKATIEKLESPRFGFAYNVQIWVSVDGGKTFGYAGNGRFCRTLEEAREYAASSAANN